MKGISGLSYRPYLPFDQSAEADNPYIVRIAPSERAVAVEIIDNGAPGARHVVWIRIKGAPGKWREIPMDEPTIVISDLQPYTDYELYVRRAGGDAQSAIRLARTGYYPDSMVTYLHPLDQAFSFAGNYPCEPTLVRAPSGALVSATSYYGHGTPQQMMTVFRSEDDGKSWRYACDLFPANWGTLFMRGDELYMLAVTSENGHVLIGVSHDEGRTWSMPSLLFVGGESARGVGFQRQPMPIVTVDGRIMTSIEYGSWNCARRFGIATLSAPENADLMDPKNWTLSNLTHYDPQWPGAPKGGNVSLLEGSIFEAGDGRLINMLRMQIADADPNCFRACLLEIDRNDLEAAPRFFKIIDMPTGANSRTHALYDAVSGKYFCIGNLVTDPQKPSMRSVMALCISDNGYDWRVMKILIDYREMNPLEVGFQYTSFIFDGDDILYVTRTAFNQAHNFHDANCQTFGKVANFRALS